MSASRFQVGPVRPAQHWKAPDGVTWRFVAANNRTVARSAVTYPDVASCTAAIHRMRRHLPREHVEAHPDHQTRQWTWRVRVAGEVVATADRVTARRVRAEAAGQEFKRLVPAAGAEQVNFPLNGPVGTPM